MGGMWAAGAPVDMGVASVGDAEPLLPPLRSWQPCGGGGGGGTRLGVGARGQAVELGAHVSSLPQMMFSEDDIHGIFEQAKRERRHFAVVAPCHIDGTWDCGGGTVRVLFHPGATAEDVIKARFYVEALSSYSSTYKTLGFNAENVESNRLQMLKEADAFLVALHENGWDTDQHLFPVGLPRFDWTTR